MKMHKRLLCFLFFAYANTALAQHGSVQLLEQALLFDTASFKACHASTIEKVNNTLLVA